MVDVMLVDIVSMNECVRSEEKKTSSFKHAA